MSKLWGTSGGTADKPEPEKRTGRSAEASGDQPGYHDPRVYVAFELRDNAERLDIRPAKGLAHAPAYSSLLDVVYDYEKHETFALIFMFMVVKVEGRYLEQLIHSIRYGNCGGIREFAAKQHDKPAQGEPIITRMEIITQTEKE